MKARPNRQLFEQSVEACSMDFDEYQSAVMRMTLEDMVHDAVVHGMTSKDEIADWLGWLKPEKLAVIDDVLNG